VTKVGSVSLHLECVDRLDGTEMAAACPSDFRDTEIALQTSSDRGSEASTSARLSEQSSWYAIRVRPRWEKVVASALHAKDYEEFVPVYRKRSRWSDRVKEIDLPLFPGYVFCRSDWSGRPPLITTPGVIGILRFGNSPAIISQQEIDAVKAVIQSGAKAGPWPYLSEGQRVRILRGALAGVEGILVRAKSDWRIVLSVDVLCRSVAVEVDREWAVPIC
jgi:transcription antitermination factor NusG